MAKRVSLLERQQKLIEERRWWNGPAASPATVDALPSSCRTMLSFAERQDEALTRQGRHNATAASRHAVAMPDHEDPQDNDDAASSAARLSHAPSLHPSMAGTVVSKACSEFTIGAGDDTGY